MRRRDIPELATANFIFEVVDRILLPYQIEWMHCDDPIAFFEKSRRIGITWATAAKAVEKAATPKADGGSDVYYIGSDESLGKEFIGDCTEWAEAYNLILEEQEEIEQYDAGTGEWETVEAGALIDLEDDTKAKALSLKFESGNKIQALTSNVNTLRGREGLIILDEAAFHKPGVLADFMKAATPIIGRGGQVLVISTHNGADSEFNRWIEDINSGRKPGRVYRTTFDDALADGYYMRNIANLPAFKKRGYKKSKKWEAKYREEILRMADEDADEEFHVIPRASAGVYIPKHLAMQCQLKTATVLRRQYDKDEWSKHLDIRRREMQNWISDVLEVHRKRWTHCGPMVLGYDYGAVSDPACFYLFRDTPHGPVTEWSYEAKLLPVEQQETILAWFLEGFPGLHTVNMDKTGPGHDIWQRIASRFGEARVRGTSISDAWYKSVIPALKKKLENKQIQIPQDELVIHDLSGFRLVNNVPKLPRSKAQKGRNTRHFDSAIAIALASEVALGAPFEVQYRPAPRTRDNRRSIRKLY